MRFRRLNRTVNRLFRLHQCIHIYSLSTFHSFKPYQSMNRITTKMTKLSIYKHSFHHFTVTPLQKDGTMSLLQYGDKQIYLIGTSHVSSSSAEQVRKVIQEIKPDTVFVELCPERAQKIWQKIRENENNSSSNKEIVNITSEEWMNELPFAQQFKQMNQRMQKMLEGFGLVYGGEFYASLEEAEKINANIVYGDRDVRVTMQRLNDGMAQIWESMKGGFSWKDQWNQHKEVMKGINIKTGKKENASDWYSKSEDGKRHSFGKQANNAWNSWFHIDEKQQSQFENMSFLDAIKYGWKRGKEQRENMKKKMPQNNWSELWGMFTNPEETIEAMKDRDKIREKFASFREFAPELTKGLVDERDEIMANNLKQCKGKTIVAVVGIGHMDGMEDYFKNV